MLKPDDSLFVDLTPTLKKDKDDFKTSLTFVDKSKSTNAYTSRQGPSISYMEASMTEKVAGNANTSKLNA